MEPKFTVEEEIRRLAEIARKIAEVSQMEPEISLVRYEMALARARRAEQEIAAKCPTPFGPVEQLRSALIKAREAAKALVLAFEESEAK